ncbi:unnamed protein product [Prorocentrum cordatum]|uniref:Uncharacterized protein n=1 Tax=Prorocentrum cordatum TaxID=2364126 RepID=A0ABN9RDG2_9DINO|nr:unnamed protein product [Polarella glacialis]
MLAQGHSSVSAADASRSLSSGWLQLAFGKSAAACAGKVWQSPAPIWPQLACGKLADACAGKSAFRNLGANRALTASLPMRPPGCMAVCCGGRSMERQPAAK